MLWEIVFFVADFVKFQRKNFELAIFPCLTLLVILLKEYLFPRQVLICRGLTIWNLVVLSRKSSTNTHWYLLHILADWIVAEDLLCANGCGVYASNELWAAGVGETSFRVASRYATWSVSEENSLQAANAINQFRGISCKEGRWLFCKTFFVLSSAAHKLASPYWLS